MKMSGLKEDSLTFGNNGYWTEGQERTDLEASQRLEKQQYLEQKVNICKRKALGREVKMLVECEADGRIFRLLMEIQYWCLAEYKHAVFSLLLFVSFVPLFNQFSPFFKVLVFGVE